MQSKYHDEQTIKETFTHNFQIPVGDSAPSAGIRHTSLTAVSLDRPIHSDAHTCSYGRLYCHTYASLVSGFGHEITASGNIYILLESRKISGAEFGGIHECEAANVTQGRFGNNVFGMSRCTTNGTTEMELEVIAEEARYDKNLKYKYHVLLQGNANVAEIYKTYQMKRHNIYILAKRANDEFSRLRYLLSIYLNPCLLRSLIL
jgi:hypothetical protein